jgi:hypothetical protein
VSCDVAGELLAKAVWSRQQPEPEGSEGKVEQGVVVVVDVRGQLASFAGVGESLPVAGADWSNTARSKAARS